MCREDDWGQSQTQTEEPAITEEDLEIIKERETNIRQLEVSPLVRGNTAAVTHTCFQQLTLSCPLQADIMDVNQIFKDLAVMIHDQGEMIG